ncbi:MAG: bifunctional acetate--CoA ligase family protein/GNAT family N-acetyltransferase [Oxalobacteraceae bacterium]
MSIRNLHYFFAPTSVVLIGASDRLHSVGATVLSNLLAARAGSHPACTVMAVNPRHTELQGLPVYPDIVSLPVVPELAVIATPPQTVPLLISQLAAKGTRAAVVLSAGMDADHGEGRTYRQAMLDAARPFVLRILGPNCVGILSPRSHLNASFAPTDALPGKIAFVSQSGALLTAMLDWARARSIGFSCCVSLGDVADVDYGDVLDYLATDTETQAILLYIEAIRGARKFMSAARAAARSKPVLVVKVGRAPEGARAAASHTGALTGVDAVYDAAFRRAGMLRVMTTDALFDAAETLARARPVQDEALLILTNGGGPGVMATDALVTAGGKLAELSLEARQALDQVLPDNWSHGNPVDIIGDAPAERYRQALSILLEKQPDHPLLFIHSPTAIVPSSAIARSIAPLARNARSPILACWMGDAAVAEARQVFSQSDIPQFSTPERAVQAFLQVVEYRRNQRLLMQVPSADQLSEPMNLEAARALIADVLSDGRTMLSEPEAKALMTACRIPVVETRVATTPGEARRLANEIGYPVAVKILSPDISHKTEVGGVLLDLGDGDAVEAAALALRERLHRLRPLAALAGFSVQAMVRRPGAEELIVGISSDPVFGPVVLFGQGGIAVEVISDRALALPPLNEILAQDLISRTRVSALLQGYRDRPPVDTKALHHLLIQIGQVAVSLPEVIDLDLNPVLADSHGVIALDARVRVSPVNTRCADDRLAIRPYPSALEQWLYWRGEPLLLRPIRPEDGEAYQRFFQSLDPVDVRFPMFVTMHALRPSQRVRMTQIDYDREMAFVAVRKQAEDDPEEMLGVVRAIADPDNQDAEFAILVRSDLKGQGLGKLLMHQLIDYFQRRGTRQLIGEALPDNQALLGLVRRFGFEMSHEPLQKIVTLRLNLQSTTDED